MAARSSACASSGLLSTSASLNSGGADDTDNWGRRMRRARLKKRDDHRRAAQAKRQKIRHIGAEAAKRPLPFGKTSRWKRTLAGKIVPRE